MNKLVTFCLDFAKKYNDLNLGIYKSENGKYTIAKVDSAEFDGPARVNTITGIVEIKNNLEYSVSGILFLLVWCFVRHVYLKEDSILTNNVEIDNKTIELLADCPEFSPKEGMVDVISFLSENEENIKRIEKLLKNKKLLK
jgi:hypothetical protein